jgi:DNA-directed RNA polymerase specialized sigma54-like protein
MSTEINEGVVELRLLSLSQIAEQLEIHRSTIYRKLKKRGIKLPGGLIGPKWQEVILKVLSNETIDEETLKNLITESN